MGQVQPATTFGLVLSASGLKADTDAEWDAVSADDAGPGAQQEGQRQTLGGLDWRRGGGGHAGGWCGHRRRGTGGGRPGGWWRWNRRRGIDRQPGYRDTGGVDCALQAGGRSGGTAGAVV